MKTSNLTSLLILALFLTGCLGRRAYTVLGIRPIYPAMNHSLDDRYQTIDTLSPNLIWQTPKLTNQIYELCIWETPYRSAEDVKRKDAQLEGSWGTPIYYTNNIAGTNHQVAIRLKPNAYYNWAVHIQNNPKVKRWSAYSEQEWILWQPGLDHRNIPFGFKTPPQ